MSPEDDLEISVISPAFITPRGLFEDSDNDLPSLSDNVAFSDGENLGPLTIEECIDVLELILDNWTPMKLLNIGGLAAFI